MQIEMPTTVLVDINTLFIDVPVNYGEEDIPNNFPGRNGDMLSWEIDFDTGKIKDYSWPEEFSFHMKVVDCGIYRLTGRYNINPEGMQQPKVEFSRVNDYVPAGLAIGDCGYGDYIIFDIAPDGTIKNWKPTAFDLDEFTLT